MAVIQILYRDWKALDQSHFDGQPSLSRLCRSCLCRSASAQAGTRFSVGPCIGSGNNQTIVESLACNLRLPRLDPEIAGSRKLRFNTNAATNHLEKCSSLFYKASFNIAVLWRTQGVQTNRKVCNRLHTMGLSNPSAEPLHKK